MLHYWPWICNWLPFLFRKKYNSSLVCAKPLFYHHLCRAWFYDCTLMCHLIGVDLTNYCVRTFICNSRTKNISAKKSGRCVGISPFIYTKYVTQQHLPGTTIKPTRTWWYLNDFFLWQFYISCRKSLWAIFKIFLNAVPKQCLLIFYFWCASKRMKNHNHVCCSKIVKSCSKNRRDPQVYLEILMYQNSLQCTIALIASAKNSNL